MSNIKKNQENIQNNIQAEIDFEKICVPYLRTYQVLTKVL